MSASKQSTTDRIRAPIGISLPASPSGYPEPSQFSSKHCSHCGARTFDAPADGDADAGADGAAAAEAHLCPRCRGALVVTAIGSAMLEECGACGGVWVDAQSFQQICQSREQQAAYVGAGSPLPAPSLGAADHHDSVQYVKCPDCGQLMNRMNFARHSGVVVDVCKPSRSVWQNIWALLTRNK